MPHGPPRRRRARPVADVPIDALLLRADDLAKGWLLALVEQAPLHEAPSILAADLSRDGPRLCDAVVRGLADDVDLRRLGPGGVLEPLVAGVGVITGAAGLPATSQAVDALHAVIWSALRSELADPDGGQVSDLAERLMLVIEHVRGAALRALSAAPATDLEPRATPAPHVVPHAVPQAVPQAIPRPDEGADVLWKSALYDEVGRAARSGAPLSLLIVELAEAERVISIEGRAGAGVTLGRFARAVRSAVRPGDILVCESDTRAWIIATNTGRPGARALADRVAAAVRAAEPWRGAPLGVSAGLAVFREDGADVRELIDAAEEARFAAEASGVAVIPEDGLTEAGLEPEVDPAV